MDLNKPKMKKALSLFLTLSLVLSGVLFAFPQKANAEMTHVYLKYKKTENVLVDRHMGYAVDLGSRAKGAKKITVSTSNKKVTNDLFSMDGDVYFYAKKAGKATVTVKVKKSNGTVKKYTFNVKASKNTPAIKTVKLGKMNLTKKLNKNSYIDIKPAKKKMKLTVTPAKGWKIKTIKYTSDFFGDDGSYKHVKKKVKNKSNINFHKDAHYSEEVYIVLVYTANKSITREYSLSTDY